MKFSPPHPGRTAPWLPLHLFLEANYFAILSWSLQTLQYYNMLLSDIIWSLSKRTPKLPFLWQVFKGHFNTSDTPRLQSFGQGRQQRLQGQVIVPLRKELNAKAMFMSVMSISHMNFGTLISSVTEMHCPHHRFCKTSSLSSRSIHECRMVQCRVPKSRWLPGVSENGDHGDP